MILLNKIDQNNITPLSPLELKFLTAHFSMGGTFFLNFPNIGTLDGRGFDINAILFALQNVTVEMLSWKCSRYVLENNLKKP